MFIFPITISFLTSASSSILITKNKYSEILYQYGNKLLNVENIERIPETITKNNFCHLPPKNIDVLIIV